MTSYSTPKAITVFYPTYSNTCPATFIANDSTPSTRPSLGARIRDLVKAGSNTPIHASAAPVTASKSHENKAHVQRESSGHDVARLTSSFESGRTSFGSAGAEGDVEELAPTPEETERERRKQGRRMFNIYIEKDTLVEIGFATAFRW